MANLTFTKKELEFIKLHIPVSFSTFEVIGKINANIAYINDCDSFSEINHAPVFSMPDAPLHHRVCE